MEINRIDFNYGGSIEGLRKESNEEIIEFAKIFAERAMDKYYYMQNDNFDCSIFLHRIWVINFVLNERKLTEHIIKDIRRELHKAGLESSEYEHELVHMRINNLFGWCT